MCDKNCMMNELNRFTKFISDAGGRDKFSKSIQYGSKLVFYILAKQGSAAGDQDKLALSKQFNALSAGVSTSRKCDRLFKFLVEYEKIGQLLTEPNTDALMTGLKIGYSFGFALYWYYDNKVFMGKIGVWKDLDVKWNGVKAARWWLLGLLFGFAIVAREMGILQKKMRKEEASDSFSTSKTRNAIFMKQLQFVALVGDTICAANSAGVVEKALGHDLNDGITSVAGLVSALLTCYKLYN